MENITTVEQKKNCTSETENNKITTNNDQSNNLTKIYTQSRVRPICGKQLISAGQCMQRLSGWTSYIHYII